jgi:hypothetical protein
MQTDMRLHQIGIKHGTDKATYHNFCKFYEAYLPKTVNHVLEIGVLDGASLRMWGEYYGTSEVFGWDINPIKCEYPVIAVDAHSREQIEQHTDKFDLIVDDGPHTMRSQHLLFGILFPHCKTYVIEDLHTCERPEYQDGTPTTLEMLSALDSPLWTRSEREYIRANVGEIRIYRDKPHDSWTGIITKK